MNSNNTGRVNDSYALIVINSTRGLREQSKPKYRKKIPLKKFVTAISKFCLTCVVIGTIAGSIITNGITKFKDNLYASALAQESSYEFKTEVISPNTHRTNDLQNYWYDYNEIAKNIETDQDLFYAYDNLGKAYTDKLLENNIDAYSSVDDFLSKKGYESTAEWRQAATKQIVLEKEIEEKQGELDAMMQDSQIASVNIASTNLGGK